MSPTFPPQSPYRWPRPGLFKGTTHQRPFSFLHSDSTMQRQQQVSFQNCIKKKIRVGMSGTARGHRFISQIMRRPGAQGHPCTTARICREQGGLRNSDSTQQPERLRRSHLLDLRTWILHSVWGRALHAVALGHLFSPIFIMMLQVPAQPVITSESSALFPSLANLCVNLKT